MDKKYLDDLMDTKEGRETVWHLLEQTAIFQDAKTDFNLGRQSLGKKIYRDLIYDKDFQGRFLQMHEERHIRENTRKNK